MDCPGYNYAKLDSMDTDPEVYKQGDDLKVLIEPQSPLVDETPYKYAPSKPPKRAKKKKRVLSTLDILISIFIVTPCVVGCWRGIWQIMDIYAIYFPPWESFIIGSATYLVLALGQDVFHHVVVEKEPSNTFVRLFTLFLMKFYITTFNVICNMIWRAGWLLFDRYCGLQTTSSGIALWEGSASAIWFTIVCTLLLFCVKGLKNTLSPPFSIALDSKDEVFLFSTRYIYKIGEKTSLYILDCLFSVLVVGTLVVFVWRGGWALLDLFVFPEDEVLSAWASLILGYASVAVAFILQPVMRYLCERFSGTPRLLIADVFILFALFGTINVWRGIWNLLNIYFLPENPELSCWITHWVCLIVLILLGCSNSLLVRGVYIDAEEPAGKCVVFPCYYLRVLFQGEKLKQLTMTSLTIQNLKVHMRDSEKATDNNHIMSVSTISTTVEENHKGSCC